MSLDFFVGRKEEIERLNLLFSKRSASLVVIRGRRRIGKSRLVEEFAKKKNFIRFSGLPPTESITAQTQREIFAKQMTDQLGLPGLSATDWSDLFTFLSRQAYKKQTVILFDEISWMGSKDPTFLGKLKNAWDIEFNKNSNLILILCGSVSTWIEQNIINSTAFFGRISLDLTLEELSLKECSQFFERQGFKGSIHNKFKLLSVTGGVPWYLEHIQPSLNSEENIKNLCFRKDSILAKEFDLIFHDLFSKRSELYKSIVELLVNGSLEFSQICQKLNYANSGVLTQYLEDLDKAGFISRDYTWLLKSGKASKLSHFRLSDNYLRFYLKYVASYKNKILANEFKDISLSSLSYWDTVMGLQFENLVLKNRYIIHRSLQIRPEDIIAANPFFQRKTELQHGCQIDYLIQTRFNTLFACEIKFSKSLIRTSIIHDMQEKMNNLKLPRRFSCFPVLIHVNGVQEEVEDSNFFIKIIDLSTFL